MKAEYSTKEKIEDLARIENILAEVVRLFKPKIKGEENNIKFLFCACISKNLPRDYRLHVIITSQSSAGKSNLVNTILEPFKEDVLDFTEYTNAFLNRTESNMDGLIFKMEQIEKTNDKKQVSLGTMKFMLSEGKMRIGLVEKNEKGKNTPKVLEVNGIPVFISTSTNYNLDPETINRTFQMQVDESEEQTKRIISHVLEKYSTINHSEEWENSLQRLYEISQIYKDTAKQFKGIYIPFADKIKDMVPSVNLTIRRDLPKILNLTCVIAFLNFTKRKKIPFDGGQYFYDNLQAHKMASYFLIAEPEDFKQALEIGGETIQQTLNKINSSSMEIYRTFMDAYNENPLGGVTTSDLKTRTKLSQNRVGELLKQLYDMGFLRRDRDGKEFRYFPTEKKFENIRAESISFSEEEFHKWLESQNIEKKVSMCLVEKSVFGTTD
jgi:DNA-binding transcriptional ArsR family regulator